MNDGRTFVTLEVALSMLPDGDIIHTFSNPIYGIMIGADWKHDDIIDYFQKNKGRIELAGEMATRMNHGLVVVEENRRLFFETRKPS